MMRSPSLSCHRACNRSAWLLFFTGNAINLFAVETWTFMIAVYPIYRFFGSGAITALIVVRRHHSRK